MPTLIYKGETFSCVTAIKGSDYIHLLDAEGVMVAAFDEISDFSVFSLSGGSYTSPTDDHNCYLAVIRDDGTIGKGGHTCKDVGSHAARHAAGGADPITPSMIGAAANRNLLDNWYFLDPINQRGQLSYSGVGYCIDRWYIVNTKAAVTCDESGLAVNSSTYNTWVLRQSVNHFEQYAGKVVTFSVLVGSIKGTWEIAIYGASANDNRAYTSITAAGLYQVAYQVPDMPTKLEVDLIPRSSNPTISVSAAKLELGNVQTLAHQDARGNWVLNDPPPDKGLELLKCIQSSVDSTDTYANKTIFHTGNKPTGTYTGTGEARTINTGGVGNAVVIFGAAQYMAIVTPAGAFCFDALENDFWSSRYGPTFINGVITIPSDDGDDICLNDLDTEYIYHVL